MEARFLFLENEVKIFDFFHSADDAAAGNPYNTTFQMSIVSNGFAGKGRWDCDIKDFRQFVTELDKMRQFQTVQVNLLDLGYASHICFQMTHTGHICVAGVLFGPMATQQVTFEFLADQTVLSLFTKELRLLLP